MSLQRHKQINEFEEEWDVCIVLKYLIMKYLLFTKEKRVTLLWRNLADTTLI